MMVVRRICPFRQKAALLATAAVILTGASAGISPPTASATTHTYCHSAVQPHSYCGALAIGRFYLNTVEWQYVGSTPLCENAWFYPSGQEVSARCSGTGYVDSGRSLVLPYEVGAQVTLGAYNQYGAVRTLVGWGTY